VKFQTKLSNPNIIQIRLNRNYNPIQIHEKAENPQDLNPRSSRQPASESESENVTPPASGTRLKTHYPAGCSTGKPDSDHLWCETTAVRFPTSQQKCRLFQGNPKHAIIVFANYERLSSCVNKVVRNIFNVWHFTYVG